MDFQNRAGGKTGSGGVASASKSNRDRRERLRQLALETIDLNKVRSIHFYQCGNTEVHSKTPIPSVVLGTVTRHIDYTVTTTVTM